MTQCRHGLLEITDAAAMPRHSKLLVADGITWGNDEVVQALSSVLYEVDHGVSLAAEKRIPDSRMQRPCRHPSMVWRKALLNVVSTKREEIRRLLPLRRLETRDHAQRVPLSFPCSPSVANGISFTTYILRHATMIAFGQFEHPQVGRH